MVRPLEHQERLSSQEYVNRVRAADHGHHAGSRDFAYEIRELTDEERRQRHASPDFGEDTFERSGDDPDAEPESRQAHGSAPDTTDDTNLDITV